MGNSESANPIRNMDKRTARREYGDTFSGAILAFRNKYKQKSKITAIATEWTDGNIRVYVRKRPIFKHETDNFEFDVATCVNDKAIVIHDCRMHADMKHQLINHNTFEFDTVFDEATNNEVVYENSAKNLVNITLNGGFSTCLVYGQTGSGKTFTMTSIYEKAARDIFKRLHEVTDRFSKPPIVSITFVEIAGDRCSDLLNGFQAAQLLTSTDGSVYPFPVVEPVVDSADALMALIGHGMGIRTTAATGVHDQSSRSHAILRIYIQRPDLPPIKGPKDVYGHDINTPIEGTLTLVDLAGSEHRIDSMYHGKERRKETGNINASLMALKECIRARAAGKNLSHQYRKSKLTMALKTSFSLPTARTIVIATVSPASKDTEHSLNTLRHACIMHGQQDTGSGGSAYTTSGAAAGVINEETRFVTGGSVQVEQVGEVNLTALARKNKQIKKLGGVLDGPKTSNGNAVENSKKAKEANKEVELTDLEKEKLKRQVERKSFAKLPAEIKELLTYHRTQLGNEERQLFRMRRIATGEMHQPGDDVDEADEEGEDDAANEDDAGSGDEYANYHIDHKDYSAKPHGSSAHHPQNGGNKMSTKQQQSQQQLHDDNDEEEDYYENEFESADERENEDVQYVSKSMQQIQLQQRQQQQQQQSNRHQSSPPPPPPKQTPPRHLTGSHTSKAAVKSEPRITFSDLYDSIYCVLDDEDNDVPEKILRKQLITLLTKHGYSAEESIELILERQERGRGGLSNHQHSSSSNSSRRQPAVKVSPRGEVPVASQQQTQQQRSKPQLSSHHQQHQQHQQHNRDNDTQQVPTMSARRPQPKPLPVQPSQQHDEDYFQEERLLTPPVKNKRPPVTSTVTATTAPKSGTGVVKKSTSSSPPPVVTIAGKPAKHFKSRFDDDETSVSSAQHAQQTSAEIARDKERRMAEEKERRRIAGVEAARQQLEEQASLRKQRHEAAKALRERENAVRLAKAAAVRNASKPIQEEQNEYSSNSPPRGSYGGQGGPEFHEAEIARLTVEIQTSGISSSTIFGIRKTIATHKAALLKLHRGAQSTSQQKSNLDDGGNDDDQSLSALQFKMRAADKSRYALPVAVPPTVSTAVKNSPRDDQPSYDMHRQNSHQQQYQQQHSISRPHYNEYSDYQRQQQATHADYNRDASHGGGGGYQSLSQYQQHQPPAAQYHYDNEYSSHNSLENYQQQQFHQQVAVPTSQPVARGRFAHRQSIGASAAPFANDYSWNTGEDN